MSTKKEDQAPTKSKDLDPADIEKIGKKRKLKIILGVSGIALASLGGGGFFAFKTFFQKKPTEMHAKTLEAKTPAPAHDLEANTDEHAEKGKESSKDTSADGQHAKEKGTEDKSVKEKSTKEKSTSEKPAGDKDKASDNHDKPAEGQEKADANKKDAGPTAASSDKSTGAKKYGDNFEIPKMDLNLNNPLENRYLRLAMTLEHKGAKAQDEELARRLPQLKDIIINSVTKRNRMELLNETGKLNLRKELKNRFNEILEKPIENVYFTEFLVE